MSDTSTTAVPAAPVPEQAQGAHVAPAPAPAATPAPKSASDRLKRIRPGKEIVTLTDVDGETFDVEIRGMDTLEAIDLSDDIPEIDEDAPARDKARVNNPPMLRAYCWDAATGERIYEGWTDEEINGQPIHVVNQLMSAISRVSGTGTDVGKN